jgi:two-component system response regulator DesR
MGNLVISIMIVGEMDLMRGALAAVLAQEEDLEVVSELPMWKGGSATAPARSAAVVILDLDRYGVEAVATVQRLVRELPESRIVALTGQQAPELMRQALDAPLWGLVSADTSPDRLVGLIRQVAAGERVIDPNLAAAALRAAENPLTEQERAALRLAAEGLPSGEIARRLFRSPGTVRNTLSAAIRKTGARTRLEAVRRAREAGWL